MKRCSAYVGACISPCLGKRLHLTTQAGRERGTAGDAACSSAVDKQSLVILCYWAVDVLAAPPTGVERSRPCLNVARLPLQVHHHLLWVWPEGGTDAMLESAQKNPEVIPELADESKVIYISKWCEMSWLTS